MFSIRKIFRKVLFLLLTPLMLDFALFWTTALPQDQEPTRCLSLHQPKIISLHALNPQQSVLLRSILCLILQFRAL